MSRSAWLVGVAVSAALATGCVERSFVVTSDPPGAVVLRDHRPIGNTPADDHFTYYGTYHFTLIKDGYQTLQVDQKIAAPWYEYFPLDFVSENLIPWVIEDKRRFPYHMEPLLVPNLDEVLSRGQSLRDRGKAIPTPPPPPPATPPAAVPAPPPPP